MSTAAVATLDLSLLPSVRLLKIASTLHIVPLALLPFAMQPGLPMGVLAAAFAASWFSLRRNSALGFGAKALTRITLAGEGATVHDQAGRQHAATLLGEQSILTSQLILLRFQLQNGGTRTRAIGGDELAPDLLRRLRVRLSTEKT